MAIRRTGRTTRDAATERALRQIEQTGLPTQLPILSNDPETPEEGATWIKATEGSATPELRAVVNGQIQTLGGGESPTPPTGSWPIGMALPMAGTYQGLYQMVADQIYAIPQFLPVSRTASGIHWFHAALTGDRKARAAIYLPYSAANVGPGDLLIASEEVTLDTYESTANFEPTAVSGLVWLCVQTSYNCNVPTVHYLSAWKPHYYTTGPGGGQQYREGATYWVRLLAGGYGTWPANFQDGGTATPYGASRHVLELVLDS